MPDNSLPSTSSSSSWLKNPENKITLTGIIFPMLMIGIIWLAVSFFGGSPGDLISHAVDNLQHIIISAVVSFCLLFVLWDDKFRAAIYYIYRSIMRHLTGAFADVDPIGSRETYVEEREKDLEMLNAGIRNLRAQSSKNKIKLAANKDELQNVIGLANQARTTNNLPMLAVYGNQLNNKEGLDKDYTEAQLRYDQLIALTTKQRDICNTRILILRDDITTRKAHMELNAATNSIVAGAKAILKGVPAEDLLYNQAGDVLDNQDAFSQGNFDDFVDITKDIMSSADLQAGANLQHVLDRLNALDAAPPNPNTGRGQGQSAGAVPAVVEALYPSQANRSAAAGNDRTDSYKDLLK